MIDAPKRSKAARRIERIAKASGTIESSNIIEGQEGQSGGNCARLVVDRGGRS